MLANNAKATAENERLSLSIIWAFALPKIAFAALNYFFIIYFMKYSTDVLLIAPAVMGVLLAGARLWDAFTDPITGYLSDRTQSRFGRRRAWMFIAAIPLGLSLVMLWSPPNLSSEIQIIAWMIVALLLFETALTAYFVPHGALGVELTQNYHERTRLFGYGHIISAVGAFLCLIALYYVDTVADKRSFISALSIGSGVSIALILLASTRILPERAEYQSMGGKSARRSFVDVFKNRYARLLLVVYGVEAFGSASVGLLFPYLLEYVWVGMSGKLMMLFLVFFVPMFLSVPIWIRLSRIFGKKEVWITSLGISVLGFVGYFLVSESGPLVWTVAVIQGAASGCSVVLAQSVQADVVDYDEYLTGERKEGVYFAAWNLTRKISASVAALIVGIVLQFAGFEPNVEQTESTKLALRILLGVVPAIAIALGALLLTRFQLNEAKHKEIRQTLESRKAQAGGGHQAT